MIMSIEGGPATGKSTFAYGMQISCETESRIFRTEISIPLWKHRVALREDPKSVIFLLLMKHLLSSVNTLKEAGQYSKEGGIAILDTSPMSIHARAYACGKQQLLDTDSLGLFQEIYTELMQASNVPPIDVGVELSCPYSDERIRRVLSAKKEHLPWYTSEHIQAADQALSCAMFALEESHRLRHYVKLNWETKRESLEKNLFTRLFEKVKTRISCIEHLNEKYDPSLSEGCVS